LTLPEEKPVTPVEKKVVAEKKAAKAPAPAAESKVATVKKAVEPKVTPVAKKPVAVKKVEQKVAEKQVSVKEKVVPKKKAAETKVAPVKEEKVPEKKSVETKAAAAEKKPAAEPKVAKKVAEPTAVPAKEEKVAEAAVPAVKQKPVAEKKVEPKVAKPPHKEWAGNPMLTPVIEKVTVNMSVGQSGRPLEQAETILKTLTNQKPSKRKAKKTIREFGIRKGESVACLVTLRDEKAEQFLRRAFYAVENKLSKYCFDRQGNFAFGIAEHINIPGTRYSPELGIHGMDVSVSLGRAGYRVKRRHRAKSKIGKDHLLTAKEAILFIKDEFDVEIA
jgi:large subunit ribosomal protein L5